MWQFFTSVLEHAGIVALLFVLTLVGGFLTIRALWKRIREAEKERTEALALVETRIETIRREEHAKRSAMREAFENEKIVLERRLNEEKREAIEKLNAELLELAECRRTEAERYASRIDDLQEKRVAETGAVMERVVRHVETTKTSLDRLASALDVLIELTKR